MNIKRLNIDEEKYKGLIEPLSVNKTDFYEIKYSRAGEVRYGPEYKHIKIYSKGVEIWDGGNNIYSAESFSNNVIGEKYDKIILLKWLSTNNPYEQVPVEINLITGREIELDMKQRYWEAGHFHSFDGVFYRKSDMHDFLCKDFCAKSDFLLFERISEKISDAFNWSITSVNDCILVYTRQKTNNVVLYNIRKCEVIDKLTMDFDLSENGSVFSRLDKNKNILWIRTDDYDLANDNRIINHRKKYFELNMNE